MPWEGPLGTGEDLFVEQTLNGKDDLWPCLLGYSHREQRWNMHTGSSPA